LLGLQFTMLTVAFIFGGLMAGALGAVGVFKVLGNTLRFFFLPTALDVLDAMLDFQDFMMGMDDGTRETVGSLFLWISAASVVVGIAAALGKAVLTVLGPLSSLKGLLISTGSGGVIGGLTTVASTIASYVPHILAVIAAVTALFALFNRFPGVASFLTDAVMFILDNLVAKIMLVFNILSNVVKGLLNIITGLVTVIVGVLTGQFDKAGKGLEEILFGLKQVFIDTIVDIVNFFINRVNNIAGMIPGVDNPLQEITSPSIGSH